MDASRLRNCAHPEVIHEIALGRRYFPIIRVRERRSASESSLKGLEHLDGYRDDEGGVLLGCHLSEGLQVTKRVPDRVPSKDLGSLSETFGGLKFALRVDDLARRSRLASA
jgi:hypothetical protein